MLLGSEEVTQSETNFHDFFPYDFRTVYDKIFFCCKEEKVNLIDLESGNDDEKSILLPEKDAKDVDKSANGSSLSTTDDNAKLAAMGNSGKDNKNSSKASSAASVDPPVVFKDKKEACEAFKELLRERNVPRTATWENALKLINKDLGSNPKWDYLCLAEKKQVFNVYKTLLEVEVITSTPITQPIRKFVYILSAVCLHIYQLFVFF